MRWLGLVLASVCGFGVLGGCGEPICEAGRRVICPCPDDEDDGIQTCKSDGESWGACKCEGDMVETDGTSAVGSAAEMDSEGAEPPSPSCMPLIEPVSSIGPLPGGGIPNSVSGGEDPTDSVPAGEGIEGKYLLKTEINGWLDHSTLGKFESTVTTYSLLLVEASNGVVYGREKQCYTDYLHVGPLGGCDEYDVGCIIYSDPDNPNSISTFVSQAVPQYTPAVVRIFDIQENGNWRTLRAPVAVGWNHQYEAETADTDPTTYVPREPPTSMDESLVAQWEDDNPGVTFRSEVNYCGESYSCETYAVQRVDPVYQGALSAPLAQGGAFNGGFVDGSRTVTNLLGASSPDCLDDGSSSAGARFVTENNLVLKRVERGDAGYFEGTGSPTVEWTCPPSELFMNP